MEVHREPEAFPGSIKYGDYLRQQRDQALEEVRFNRKDELVDIWIAARMRRASGTATWKWGLLRNPMTTRKP